MDIVTEARELYKQGRYSEAVDRIQSLAPSRLDAPTSLLKAALCEATGDLITAETIADQVLRSRVLSDPLRSSGEVILSRLAAASGDIDRELQHLHRALSLSQRLEDPDQLGWIQLRLLALTADRSGIDSCRPLMTSLRKNVSCAGNPSLTAALHMVVADVDGKHGLLSKSHRHVRLAQSLLARYPNVWLCGWAEGTLLALAIVQCDIHSALQHGDAALSLGRESGAASVIRSALANLGRLHYTVGNFPLALDFLDQALKMCARDSEHGEGIRDSIARVYMAQERLAESEQLLVRVTISDRGSVKSGGYVHRHSLLTKAEVLSRLGRRSEALPHFNEAIALALRAGDTILEDSARLLSDEAMHLSHLGASPPQISDPPVPARQQTPDSAVLYERAVICRLVLAGRVQAAIRHRDRALRICRAVKNRPAESEVLRNWKMVAVDERATPSQSAPSEGALLQDIAALLMHAGRHELVATGLVDILKHANCSVGARAVSRSADNVEDVLDEWGAITDASAVRTFPIGTSRERAVEIQLQPLPDIESQATANSVGFLIASGQELERARIAREERLTLWPVDELPAEDDDSVVAGKMREVMIFARKIAQSNAAVLLTGESGTGKEVLARALHRYSPRSKKPFVPFNCTAVPRDLLESHLFGFKRGAFTGADRDNPGLIRSARDGTLFLDEIGELGLDLQPKLLRFLESGEIQPLGEPAPCLVNVRIVAATNADLKKLVEQGRFREDLYYRLNVIPIEIPPLRERREEIAPLAQHFALKWSHDLGKGCIRVAEDLMEHLVLYPWPGNIRQLSNEINRMVATADADTPLTLAQFPRELREQTEQLKRRASGFEMAVPLSDSLAHAVSALEREMIRLALRLHHGRVEAAAGALGISRKGLYLKRRRLGL